MRKKKEFKVFLFLTAAVLLLMGCTGKPVESEPTKGNLKEQNGLSAYQELIEATDYYVKNKGLVLLGADELFQRVVMAGDPQYYLIDIRHRDDFLDASIEGSINIPFGLTYREEVISRLPKDKTIVVIDYDGGLASQTAAFWGMLDYDVMALAMGMKSWVPAPPGEETRDCYPVTQAAISRDANYHLPTITLDNELQIKELLIAQNKEIFENKEIWQISGEEVKRQMDEGKKLNLLDIREQEHYQGGHLDGSFNIPFKELVEEGNLKKIPPGEEIIIIDYYGHFSHGATRLLNQLGYQAVAMEKGMSNWIGDTEVIGRNPLVCGWLECCGVPEDQQLAEKGLTQCNCDWETYPTVETEMAAAVSSGC